jgi:hypothetical protein
MGAPSSMEKATAVQSGASWASVMRGNDFVKFTSQPGRLRMDCSAEMVRTSGVKSTLRLRTELLNSSTSVNRNTFGAWSGAKASPVILFFLGSVMRASERFCLLAAPGNSPTRIESERKHNVRQIVSPNFDSVLIYINGYSIPPTGIPRSRIKICRLQLGH